MSRRHELQAATLLLVVTLMVLMLTGGIAQAADDLELTVDEADGSDHPFVTFTVSVPRELADADLEKKGFSILENGEERPASVERLPADELEVVLLLDVSGSMKGRPIDAAKDAVNAFADRMPPGVRVAAVSFGSKVEVVQRFTTDLDEVTAAVSDLRARGETALYDGLTEAARIFPVLGDARRAVVLLSDGGDTVSAGTLDAAIVELLGFDVSFIGVTLQSPEADLSALERIQAATDGLLVPADDPDALAAIFDEVGSALVNQYVVSYDSEAHRLTEIRLEATSKGTTAVAELSLQFPAPPPPAPAPPEPEVDPAPVREITGGTVAPEVAPPRLGIVGMLGWLDDPWVVAGGAVALFLGLSVLFGVMFTGERRRRREHEPLLGKRYRRETRLTEMTERATMFAEKGLESRGPRRRPAVRLENAGLTIRPGEFVVGAVSAATVAMALGWVFLHPLVGIGIGVATLILFNAGLSLRIKKRRAAFAEQLGDTLQLISGGIRAGYGLMQAIDAVAREAPSPTADELRRLGSETNLGRETMEALGAMAARVQSEDFDWVVEAIEVHREVGGDLAEILDQAADTIRDRDRIRRRIQTLSAEGKMSAGILLGLPFLVGIAVAFTNPDYLSELTTTSAGLVMIVVGLVLMVIGTFWMRRIIRLKY